MTLSLRALIYLYGWRLKDHPIQEVLAGAGIAAAVALLFAVQIVNASRIGSLEAYTRAVAGDARFEVAARDDQGFKADLVDTIRAIAGVQAAAPVLERRATVRGPEGTTSIILVGVDPSLRLLRGTLALTLPPMEAFTPRGGIVLPEGVARDIGLRAAESARIEASGRALTTRVVATLAQDQIGSITTNRFAVGPLRWVQRIAGSRGRVSRVLVRVASGREQAVAAELERVSNGRLNVGATDAQVHRLSGITAPNDQATMLIAVIGLVLLVFNAMLLTMPERRRFVVELRTAGFTPAQVTFTLMFQAVVLGGAAATVGLALGAGLAPVLAGAMPTYLSFTFPVGTHLSVPVGSAVISVAAGVSAAALASARPLLDLQSARAIDAVYGETGDIGEGFSIALRRRMVLAGCALASAALALAVAVPATTMVAVAAIACAVLCAVPILLATVVRLIDMVARRLKRNTLVIALIGAQTTMTRSVAIAAMTAVAVFGGVSIEGARRDLIRGLYAGYGDHLRTADVWVTTSGQSLTTDAFAVPSHVLDELRRSPEIASARIYQGGMYDVGERRIWVIARPRTDRTMVPPSQLVEGEVEQATERMREGGWITMSTALAKRYRVGVGDRVAFPTPTGTRTYRVAAVTTNLSWGPGALIINTDDYRKAWGTTAASALEVDAAAGVAPGRAAQAVEKLLGHDAGYDIATASEMEEEFRSVLLDGLALLKRTAIVVLVLTGIALATAFNVTTWHRRDRLAAYRMHGFSRAQLRRILALEAVTVLSLGAFLGLMTGTLGNVLCSRWLEVITGFPAPFALRPDVALAVIAPVGVVALTLVGVGSYVAARVSPGLRLSE